MALLTASVLTVSVSCLRYHRIHLQPLAGLTSYSQMFSALYMQVITDYIAAQGPLMIGLANCHNSQYSWLLKD